MAERRFAEQLTRAQEAADRAPEGRAAQLAARPLAGVLAAQREVHDALIQVLHQLDHRTRAQEHRITELEDALARLQAGDER